MKTEEWLEKNADKISRELGNEDYLIWVTKSRGDYLTHVGMEEKLSFIEKFGIYEFVCSTWSAGSPVNIGFNPKKQKWYGWSHRAIFGFGIGSTCRKGDCHYVPVDENDFLDDMIRFWSDEDKIDVTAEHRKDGVYVEWTHDQSIPNKKLRGKINGCLNEYPDKYGKGEWDAKSLSDARQMAIDFANGVA